MQVTQTHRNSLTGRADGGRSTTIIPTNYYEKKVIVILREINDFKGYFISDDGRVFCNLGRGNRDNITGKYVSAFNYDESIKK